MTHWITWSEPKKPRRRWFLVVHKDGVTPLRGTSKAAVLAWVQQQYPEKAPFKILARPPVRRFEP